MSNRHGLSKARVMLFGLLALFLITMGYFVCVYVGSTTKSSGPSQTPQPIVNNPFPPQYPNNPTNYPLVTNYTIIIPKGLYTGGDIPLYRVSMKFIAPLTSLQSQENWTMTNCTAGRGESPYPFTTWSNKTGSSYNPDSYAQILPYVFNGTTIDVKVDVYGYNGLDVQLVYSREWNVTEYTNA